MLNGTDTVAAPGEGGTPASCFPSRGTLRRYGNWPVYVGCPLISLSPGPTLSWLTVGCLAAIPVFFFFFVWPKLSKANLNEEFH